MNIGFSGNYSRNDFLLCTQLWVFPPYANLRESYPQFTLALLKITRILRLITRISETSTLWTDAGVDQKFQSDLGAVGPCEFQRKSVWTTRFVPCFQGKSVWTNGPESWEKFPPRLALVHGCPLPEFVRAAQITPHLGACRASQGALLNGVVWQVPLLQSMSKYERAQLADASTPQPLSLPGAEM